MSRSFPAVRAVRSDGAAAVVWASVLAAASLAIAPLTMNMVKADPSFYLSYVLDYEAIAARFGQTYHGNRLSYLLIDRAAFAVLGPEAGYFAARWFVLSVAVLAAIGISRRVLGRAGALSVGAAVALTPWLPRQLLWVHYDGFAATYLLVAAWLLLGPVEQRWRRPIAGVVLALAVNANLAVLVLVAGRSWGGSWRSTCRSGNGCAESWASPSGSSPLNWRCRWCSGSSSGADPGLSRPSRSVSPCSSPVKRTPRGSSRSAWCCAPARSCSSCRSWSRWG